MHANLASIMPQVVATWCEQQGHEVKMIYYTGREDLTRELPQGIDLVFISSFTQAALLVYSLSNYFRSQGTVTVLGGPHARCYPDDAVLYFDYVLGFANQSTIAEVLDECSSHRPIGKYPADRQQPIHLPGVAERWKYIEATLKKAPFLKMVPMIGSMGCPYTCPFCIDSVVPYQPLNFQEMKDLTAYTFSPRAIYRRLKATSNYTARWMNFMRAISSEGYGRLRFYRQVRENLISDRSFRKYFEGESEELPAFYSNIIKKDLGSWWNWLPQNALRHDSNAYFRKTERNKAVLLT